jgi:hypothetical protein
MGNTLDKSMDLLSNLSKCRGYINAQRDLNTLLNELEQSKLITSQLSNYIANGMDACYNVYHNKLANDVTSNSGN